MFRKSVSFFVLLALFWVLLWVYIPDGTPNKFSIGDFFRGFFLLFSLMAFGFALLMLIIRYKGVEIASNLFPQGAFALWLGKHAFEYSQPKVVFYCCYNGTNTTIDIEISMGKQTLPLKLNNHQPQSLHLGTVTENPTINWNNTTGGNNSHQILLMQDIKLIGRNLEYDLIIEKNTVELKRR